MSSSEHTPHETVHESAHETAHGGGRRRALVGLGSVLAVALCTLWLAAVGHLDLYINPRYSVFTVVLAAVAVPASVAGLLVVARGAGHTHDHAGPDDDVVASGRSGGPARLLGTVLGGVAAAVTIALTLAMLVLPPTTLSARTAQQRSVDSATLSDATGSNGNVALLGSGSVDTAGYGVKDWAALIRQTTDTSSLVGKRVQLTGFVVPGADGTFTLTRFVISCCAVDAQPVGLVVTTDGTVPDANQWVTVSGALAANPDQASDARTVVKAQTVKRVQQPEDPYEY